MGNVFVEENILQDIANAIREKNGTETKYFPSEMADAIRNIVSSDNNALTYDMGEFVLDSDTTSAQIQHTLGTIPDFILIWTDDFSDLSENNLIPYTTSSHVGYMWLNGLFGLEQKITSAISSNFGLMVAFFIGANEYKLAAGVPSSAAYFMSDSYLPTEEYFKLIPMGNVNTKWRSGIVYKYFVSKAWWNVGGVANAE